MRVREGPGYQSTWKTSQHYSNVKIIMLSEHFLYVRHCLRPLGTWVSHPPSLLVRSTLLPPFGRRGMEAPGSRSAQSHLQGSFETPEDSHLLLDIISVLGIVPGTYWLSKTTCQMNKNHIGGPTKRWNLKPGLSKTLAPPSAPSILYRTPVRLMDSKVPFLWTINSQKVAVTCGSI